MRRQGPEQETEIRAQYQPVDGTAAAAFAATASIGQFKCGTQESGVAWFTTTVRGVTASQSGAVVTAV